MVSSELVVVGPDHAPVEDLLWGDPQLDPQQDVTRVASLGPSPASISNNSLENSGIIRVATKNKVRNPLVANRCVL